LRAVWWFLRVSRFRLNAEAVEVGDVASEHRFVEDVGSRTDDASPSSTMLP